MRKAFLKNILEAILAHSSSLLNRLLRQVQTNVHALVILYVDGDLFRQMQRGTVRHFHALEVGGDHIVSLAGGNSLGEFAGMIRIDFPLGLFIWHAADLNGDAIDGAIVGAPDRPNNERIRIGRFQIFGGGSRMGHGQDSPAQSGAEENKQ